MITDLYQLKEQLNKYGIFLSFSGPISQDLMVEMGATLKQKMRLEDAGSSTVIRVFTMLVENAQNIIHYSAEKFPNNDVNNENLRLGIITVGHEDDHYFVLCGNMIERGKVETLRNKLTLLRGMTKDELKDYYRKQRKEGPNNESKGGGLGFIEMARKASMPIEFDFKKIDDELSFFSVKIVI